MFSTQVIKWINVFGRISMRSRATAPRISTVAACQRFTWRSWIMEPEGWMGGSRKHATHKFKSKAAFQLMGTPCILKGRLLNLPEQEESVIRTSEARSGRANNSQLCH
eukprot:1158825-Pelagomonas_calceolata.AAC.7